MKIDQFKEQNAQFEHGIDFYEGNRKAAYTNGVDDVMKLNLPAKFVFWYQETFLDAVLGLKEHPKVEEFKQFKNVATSEEGYTKLFQYWLENIFEI
jgi:hypothetical protein